MIQHDERRLLHHVCASDTLRKFGAPGSAHRVVPTRNNGLEADQPQPDEAGLRQNVTVFQDGSRLLGRSVFPPRQR